MADQFSRQRNDLSGHLSSGGGTQLIGATINTGGGAVMLAPALSHDPNIYKQRKRDNRELGTGSNLRGSHPTESDGQAGEAIGSRIDDLSWEDCVKCLVFEELNERERSIDKNTDGTCEWLLMSDDYLDWVKERGLLLIRGNPGSGKSTLLKFASGKQSDEEAQSGALILSFFFYASGTELQSGITGLFRSLLFQLVDKDVESRSNFYELCRKRSTTEGRQKKSGLTLHQHELRTIFETLVLACSTRRIVRIFVDAIDECRDQDRDEVTRFFHNLKGLPQERSERPGICLTCRHHPDGQIEAEFLIRLEQKNHNDIQKFIERELRLPDETERAKNQLKQLLQTGSNGLFLWITIIIRRIHDLSSKGVNMKAIQSEISKCPQRLDGLYEDLLETIDEAELLEAGHLFQWVCFAARPLSLSELRIGMTIHASGIKSSLAEYEDENSLTYIPNEQTMKKRMTHLSRGLVDFISTNSEDGKSFIGFYHESIKEFMVTKGLQYLDSRLKEGRGLAKTANLYLANTCLNYLSTKEIGIAGLDERTGSTDQYDFLPYAMDFWLPHAIEAERSDSGEQVNWPSQQTLHTWVQIYQSTNPRSPLCPKKGTRLIHVAAEYGLVGLARWILSGDRRKKLHLVSRDRTKNPTRTRLSEGVNSNHIGAQTGARQNRARLEHLEHGTTKRLQGLQANSTTKFQLGRRTESAAGRGRQMIISTRESKNAKINTNKETPRKLSARNDEANVQDTDGNTPLYLAARSGRLEIVSLLHEHGGNIHERNNKGWTPLSVAANYGHLKVVRFLYEHGADIHTPTHHGWTPTNVASENGHLDIVKFFYEHGADTDIHKATNDGWTPINVASENGRLEIVKFLFEHGADIDIHTVANDGCTPLYIASKYGHLEVVKFLYDNGADTDIHTAMINGWTPLNIAASNGHLDVVKFLYQHGADTDINIATNEEWAPIITAADNGHLEVVKFLYDHGADIHTVAKSGWTPLSTASDSGHLEVVKFLYEHGADTDINKATNYGWTPVNLAADGGYLEVVEFLYNHGADIRTPTKAGWTPLATVSRKGHLELVKFLYEHGADSDTHVAANYGWTPINIAADNGCLEVVKYLYDHGSDIHTKSQGGWTPLSAAADSGHLEVVKFLYEHGGDTDCQTATEDGWTPLPAASDSGHLEIVKFFYGHGADIHTATKDGWTALSAASDSGHLEVVKFLYEHGADRDIHTGTKKGWMPLHLASSNGNLELLKFLYEHGADTDIHSCTKKGCVPLHLASSNGNLEVVKFLLEHGSADRSSLTSVTCMNQTPLHLAICHHHPEVVQLLLSNGSDPNSIDCYGRTCLDWISQCQGFPELLSAWSDTYIPTPLTKQREELCQTVQISTLRMKTSDSEQSFWNELGTALLLLSDSGAACIAFEQGIVYDPVENTFEHDYTCDNCQSSIKGPRSICLTCSTLSICNDCLTEQKNNGRFRLRCKEHKFLQIPHDGYDSDNIPSLILENEAKIAWLDQVAKKYASGDLVGI
ncbi:hypothetical protein BP5796_12317 [Coleophoma crateriformis]|uniref:ZZ-type domain-containing protein n=1 Tax=Coleophoma crateriformis TaxID=565419 RepID=A0A3D8Q9Q3_9HELO|nr:hypothetical protein BP5796_12317 [Coleophoma crateriformis]